MLPSFWLYFSEQKLGWQGPTDIEAALQEIPTLLPGGEPAEYQELLLQVRDAIAMGLSTGPIITRARGRRDHAELATQAPRRVGQPADRRVPLGAGARCRSPRPRSTSTRTTSWKPVDPAWLAQGVKSPKHLMLDPDNCILCRACEDVCPWNCIYMMSPGIVADAAEDAVGDEVDNATAVFVVDDNACTRCSVCVDRCPTDTLYYARLPEGSKGGQRTMAEVPRRRRSR